MRKLSLTRFTYATVAYSSISTRIPIAFFFILHKVFTKTYLVSHIEKGKIDPSTLSHFLNPTTRHSQCIGVTTTTEGVTTSRTLIKKGAAKCAEMGNAVPIVGYSVLSFD